MEKSHLVENSKRAMVNFPNITNKKLRISKECILVCVSTIYIYICVSLTGKMKKLSDMKNLGSHMEQMVQQKTF